MKEKIVDNYFPFVKLINIFSLLIYFIITNSSNSYNKNITRIGLLFLFTSTEIFYELTEKKNVILLILSAAICGALIVFHGHIYFILIPFALLDIIEYIRLPAYLYLCTFLVLLYKDQDIFIYFLSCAGCNIIYFQHYHIIKWYKEILDSFMNTEEDLKTSIENQKIRHRNDIERSRLEYENRLLEEKSSLSQALHDKIGHSINGSIYQLEACKLLIKDKPMDSKNIIQAVIDNLRSSLDEIRAILRKEKPDKSQLALLQLKKLCGDFVEKYNINAQLNCTGEAGTVPEIIWQIILDNSIEAFSNALKYSGCRTIKIDIAVLNKLVRCSIKDDGKGCDNIIDGMGLSGMKKRTKAVNGDIYVSSGFGFEINMLLPITQH